MIDFKDLLKAGVHFGHKISFGHPKMKPYLWGVKNRIHLIDISKTAFLLEYAGKKLQELASKGGAILWVGTKKPAQHVIKTVGAHLNMPFVINRWIGGTLSNFGQIKKAITRLLHLRDVLKKSTSYYTKKELVMLQKQVDRLEKNVGGIVDLEFPPAAIVVVDAKREHSAIKEAAIMNVPVFALVDTNTDPSLIDHVIPANDDAPRSIEFIIEYLAKQTEEGKKIADAKKAEAAAARKTTKATTPKKNEPKEQDLVEDDEEEEEEKTKTTTKKAVFKKTTKKPTVKKTTTTKK